MKISVAGLGIIRAADDDGVSSKTSPKSTRTKSYLLNWNAGNPDLLSNKNWLMFLEQGSLFPPKLLDFGPEHLEYFFNSADVSSIIFSTKLIKNFLIGSA